MKKNCIENKKRIGKNIRFRWRDRTIMITTWTVRSKTQLGVVYVVTREDAGNFACSCPDFEYRHHVCKHILRIKMRVAGEKQIKACIHRLDDPRKADQILDNALGRGDTGD